MGIWQRNVGNAEDTTFFWETKSFGEGFEVYMKGESRGKIIWEVKSVVGYDEKNDMLIEAMIMNFSPKIDLWSIRFLSANKYEEILLEDISNPDKAKYNSTFELKSPDLSIATYTKNNKVVSVDTLRRVKQ